ncbi:GGDEF domain-containing protein [Amorphus sp. MBR-141]
MSPSPSHFQDVRARAAGGVLSRLRSDAVFRKSALVWFTALLAGSLLVLGAGIMLVHDRERSLRLSELKAGEQGIVVAQLNEVRDHLALIRADALFLRDEYELALESRNGDAPLAAADIAGRSMNFLRTRDTYDEIRIIGTSGREAVRISHNDGSPTVVDQALLQDQSSQPYVGGAQQLDYGEIYVSPLGLSANDGVIAAPHRPTIHFATPARTSTNTSAGSIVLNYHAAPMLSSVEEAANLSTGEPVLLNADGYWLVSADPLRTWGFMFPDGKDNRMESRYPATWAAARTANSGQVQTPEGLFTYRVIDPVQNVTAPASGIESLRPSPAAPPASEGGQIWYVGTFVPAASLEEEIDEPTGASHIYIAVIIALCLAGSAAGAVAIAESRNYRRTLERLAAEDSLTGLANRRALEERLAQEIDLAQRKDRQVTIAFLDVDGFKAINDELGHAIGDQALVDIADVIDANVRSYDVVGRFRAGEPGTGAPLSARIGGDEFVIMFPDSAGPEPAAAILRRIAASGLLPGKWPLL